MSGFIGETNHGYKIIAEVGKFVPNKSEATVLGFADDRHDRYVTWRAGRDGDGKAVYWAGHYHHEFGAASTDLATR